jgi:hypothetical protein
MKRKTVWLIIGGCVVAVGLGVILVVLRLESAHSTDDEGDAKKRVRAFWAAYNRATELRSRREFASAIEFYRQALTLDPKHEDSLYSLGNCLFELGEYARAVERYEQLIAVNPQSNRGLSQLGIVLSTPAPAAVLDVARARRAFERVTEINQEESGPFLRLGLLALHENQLEQALGHFLTAAGFKSPEGYFFAGYVKYRQGCYAEAVEYFQKVLQINEREKQISGRGVFSEGDVKSASGQTLTPLERSGIKALVFLYWTAAKLGGYPRGVPPEFRIKPRANEHGFTVTRVNQGAKPVSAPMPGLNGASSGWEWVRGDYNGDGRQDAYVINPGYVSMGRNALYRNNGNDRFSDVTEEAGLDGERATARAVFVDYDRDGQMDIVEVGNAAGDQPPLRLFHNQGGRFEEVHQRAGIDFSGTAVAVAVGDADGDGWTDLFILRWKRPGLLYRNQGNGTFTDVTEQAGLAGVGGSGFSALFFDYDRDELLDLLVTAQAPYEIALECLLRPDLKREDWTPRLFRNRGNGQFEEATTQVGLDRSYGTMRAVAVDVDHDGWTDIVLANGGLEAYRLEPGVILRNIEGRKFVEGAHLPSFDAPVNARSLAVDGLAGDGRIELHLDRGLILQCSIQESRKR